MCACLPAWEERSTTSMPATAWEALPATDAPSLPAPGRVRPPGAGRGSWPHAAAGDDIVPYHLPLSVCLYILYSSLSAFPCIYRWWWEVEVGRAWGGGISNGLQHPACLPYLSKMGVGEAEGKRLLPLGDDAPFPYCHFWRWSVLFWVFHRCLRLPPLSSLPSPSYPHLPTIPTSPSYSHSPYTYIYLFSLFFSFCYQKVNTTVLLSWPGSVERDILCLPALYFHTCASPVRARACSHRDHCLLPCWWMEEEPIPPAWPYTTHDRSALPRGMASHPFMPRCLHSSRCLPVW